MSSALEINGRIYCPHCVEEWRLDTPNPEGTDLVIEVKPPFTKRMKCYFPMCNKQIGAYAETWDVPAY